MKVKDKRLIFNAARCLKCEDVVISTHRHDFRSCMCGTVCVDGGLEYERRVGDRTSYVNLSEYEEFERDEFSWEQEIREYRERKDGDKHHRGYN